MYPAGTENNPSAPWNEPTIYWTGTECPICGSEDLDETYYIKAFSHKRVDEYICNDCGYEAPCENFENYSS